MLLRQTSNHLITVDVTATSSPLDESLELIARFISARLAPASDTESTDIVIDVGFLGLAHPATQLIEKWPDQYVYPLRLSFSTILFGPISQAGISGGPCSLCLERRWLSTRNREELHARQRGQKMLITGPHAKLHYAALEALWLIIESDLYGQPATQLCISEQAWFTALNLDTLQIEHHQLIVDASCPRCTRPEIDRPDAISWQLTSRPKPFAAADRLIAPMDYALPEQGYINPLSGMLGAAAQPELFHTVTAPVGGTYHIMDQSGRAISTIGWGGHGTTFQISQRIGLLEGLERYCGQWPRARQPDVIASYHQLASEALDPRSCGLYDPELYRTAKSPKPFDPDCDMTWVWGYSFRDERPLLIPEQLAYYFGQHEHRFVHDTSSGCAIGSCLEEAILHGILELIERDSFLMHWYARLSAPRLDPWSAQDIKTLRLADRIERQGYNLYLLDTRLDLCIPTVTALAVSKKDTLGKFLLAAGASLDPEDAIRAAVSEMAASIPGLSERVATKLDHVQRLAADYTKVQSIEDHTLLFGLPEMAQHASFLYQNPALQSIEDTYEHWNSQRQQTSDLREDVYYLLDRILGASMDVIVVDQTAPELQKTGLKVVRVIVPGLIPMGFGWKKNRVFNLPRMRTVPRTAGYQSTDFDLAQLNLIPHPFP